MRIAVCQLNAREDRDTNLKTARTLLEQAAVAGADLAVLPEYTDFLGRSADEPAPETLDGTYGRFFATAARELGMWVHAGSFHEVGPDPDHTYNTSLVFDRSGGLAATYRKIHLYDVEIAGRVSYRESARVSPGAEIVAVDVDSVRVGLSICYDLRFPELYRALAVAEQARVLVVPAAFMMHTGRDHWEVLLRARAIENQCYVVAAGQIGDHRRHACDRLSDSRRVSRRHGKLPRRPTADHQHHRHGGHHPRERHSADERHRPLAGGRRRRHRGRHGGRRPAARAARLDHAGRGSRRAGRIRRRRTGDTRRRRPPTRI
jgi:predicted amidohydrolase